MYIYLTHFRIYAYTCTYTHIYIYMYRCTFVYTHIHMFTYVYTYISIQRSSNVVKPTVSLPEMGMRHAVHLEAEELKKQDSLRVAFS